MAGERRSSARRAFWDLTICGAGLIYLILVLFMNLSSPLFGFVLIMLAGYELFRPDGHRRVK
jgi:fatty acid desaturase